MRTNILTTTSPEDAAFHASRVMFCIKDNNIVVAPKGTELSHLEWFEHEGWINNAHPFDFLEKTIRGFYAPETNTLYVYSGVGFYFTTDTIEHMKGFGDELQQKIGCNRDTTICFGPKDRVIKGQAYEQRCVGSLKDFCT